MLTNYKNTAWDTICICGDITVISSLTDIDCTECFYLDLMPDDKAEGRAPVSPPVLAYCKRSDFGSDEGFNEACANINEDNEVDFSSFIQQEKLHKEHNNLLCLVGRRAQNLLSPAYAQDLSNFTTIAVRLNKDKSKVPSFKSRARITELVKRYGFALTDIEDDGSVLVYEQDGYCIQLKEERQLLREECAAFEQKIGQQKEQYEAERENLGNVNVRVTVERDELSKRVLELELALSAVKSEKDKLAQSKQSELGQLNSEKDELFKRVSGLESALSTLKIDKEQLIQGLNLRIKERDREAHWHQEYKEKAEWRHKLIGELEQEAKEKEQSIRLGQKMHVKAQIDLDALRESYAEKAKNEQELVELVKELKEKLTIASHYYRKLEEQHPELLSTNTKKVD